jgi:hypothetical protein
LENRACNFFPFSGNINSFQLFPSFLQISMNDSLSLGEIGKNGRFGKLVEYLKSND